MKEKKKNEKEEEFPLLSGLKSPEFSIEDIKNKSIWELYTSVKLPKEVIDDILKIGDESFEKYCKDTFKVHQETEKGEEVKNKLKECYFNLIDILKTYCDLKPEYYSIISLWIIGTYFHDKLYTYPYLYFNAMKGSGKSRLLRLVTYLSKEGKMLNSLTEAVLFRTKGTLGIDEFEGLSRKGNEALKELLNSAYKKGIKVQRLKKVNQKGEEKQVVEEFEVFRPIIMANIYGIGEVLEDRTITLILERSSNPIITRLTEIFELDDTIQRTKNLLFSSLGVGCAVSDALWETYKDWNNMVMLHTPQALHTLHTQPTHPTPNTSLYIYTNINKELNGRDLELCLPLLIIASMISKEVLDSSIKILEDIILIKKEDQFNENRDISLYDFISQELEVTYFISLKELVSKYKDFVGSSEEWMTPEWMGRALKRLNLITEKRRMRYGREVKVNYQKAKEKIRIFK